MVSAITPQYSQYSQYQQLQQPAATPQQSAQYYPQTSPVSSGANAVNIQIYSPTAYGGQTPANPYPYSYHCQCPTCTGQGMNPNTNGNIDINANANANADANVNINTGSTAAAPTANEPKKDGDKEKIIALTDAYMQSLENYLNNQDPKIRMQGVNELLKRFKEDKSRINDAALTALLNKTLQDPYSSVRFIALTILDTGYARGSDETVSILKQLENQINSGSVQVGEDARLASKVLLKMSGETVEVPAGTGHNPPKPAEKSKEEKVREKTMKKAGIEA